MVVFLRPRDFMNCGGEVWGTGRGRGYSSVVPTNDTANACRARTRTHHPCGRRGSQRECTVVAVPGNPQHKRNVDMAQSIRRGDQAGVEDSWDTTFAPRPGADARDKGGVLTGGGQGAQQGASEKRVKVQGL